ncbi:MAG: hypothetical protein M3478_04625 [Planctomycetota bacterium]|nr:hypothetical protein [Planctomycetota bacterium]
MIFGDAGADSLDGGTGDDDLLGGDGVDVIRGGADNDDFDVLRDTATREIDDLLPEDDGPNTFSAGDSLFQ